MTSISAFPASAGVPSRTLVATAAAILVSGCTSLSGFGGGSSLSCGLPEGVHCDSVSNTYAEATRSGLPGQKRRTGEPSMGTDEALPDERRDGAAAQQRAALRADSPAVDGMPLRSTPRVLRLWIKPWEDADGDLHDQTYVYLAIEEGRWMVEHQQRAVRDPYAPVRAGLPPPVAASPTVPAMTQVPPDPAQQAMRSAVIQRLQEGQQRGN